MPGRKAHGASFKSKMALEAGGYPSVTESAAKYEDHPAMAAKRKKQAI